MYVNFQNWAKIILQKETNCIPRVWDLSIYFLFSISDIENNEGGGSTNGK